MRNVERERSGCRASSFGVRFFFFRSATTHTFFFDSLSRSFEGDEESKRSFSFRRFHNPFFSCPQEPGCVARPFASLRCVVLSRERQRSERAKEEDSESFFFVFFVFSRRLFCSLPPCLFVPALFPIPRSSCDVFSSFRGGKHAKHETNRSRTGSRRVEKKQANDNKT